MKLFSLRVGAIAAFLFGHLAPAGAEDFKSDADLVAAVMPSFVNVYNRGVVATPPAEGSGASIPQIHDEVGSGFIVDPSGLIITNRHVIDGAYALFVTLSDGTHVPATLVAKALNFDIALIKVDVGHPLQAARLGDVEKARVGDHVVAIGNPLGFASSASAGIISAFHRNVGLSSYDDLIQTDATINQGNSGGPLFNMSGEVIGINQAIYTRNQGGSIGIGFSIPINSVKYIFEDVKKYGQPRIGWLGVTVQTFTASMGSALGLGNPGGVIISDLVAQAPAEKAGLKVGDIILKIGDDQIIGTASLNISVSHAVDQTVPVRLIRDGKPMTVSVAIGVWPKELWSSKLADPPHLNSLADAGITFASMAETDAPVIKAVAEKSIAWSAGVQAGDIIRRVQTTDIHTMGDLRKVVTEQHDKGIDNAVVLLGGPNGSRWIDMSIKE